MVLITQNMACTDLNINRRSPRYSYAHEPLPIEILCGEYDYIDQISYEFQALFGLRLTFYHKKLFLHNFTMVLWCRRCGVFVIISKAVIKKLMIFFYTESKFSFLLNECQ